MAGNKYLERNGTTGKVTEVASNQTSSGAPDAGKVVALGTNGYLDPSVFPPGYGQDVGLMVAAEALSAHDLVYINTDGEVARAVATAGGHQADGFVLTSAAEDASVLVYFDGPITGLTGISRGVRYYLSETPGGYTTTPVSGAGKIHQYIGCGKSTTEILFEEDDGIILA